MKKNQTKDKILDSAEFLFSKHGYVAVSMDDIAKEVHITKAALYYHFKSKESLFLEMIEGEFDKFEERINKSIVKDGNAKERFRSFIIEYLKLSSGRKNFIKIVIQKFSSKDKNLLKDIKIYRDRILDLVEPFVKDVFVDMNRKVDSRFTTFMLLGVLNNVIANELIFENNKWDFEYVADQIMILIFNINNN